MTPAAIVSKLWNFCNVKCVTILLADILRLRCAISAGLRLLEEREMKLKILRKALIQGEQSADEALD